MQGLKSLAQKVMAADPSAVEVGLFTTTFWMAAIVSLPVSTSRQYGIAGLGDEFLEVLLLILLVVQGAALLYKVPAIRTGIAAVCGFFYLFSALLSFSNYPGGLGSIMIVPAFACMYVIVRLGVHERV